MTDNEEMHADASVRALLDKIKEEYRVGNVPEKKEERPGRLEFVFRDESSGLVFEEGENNAGFSDGEGKNSREFNFDVPTAFSVETVAAPAPDVAEKSEGEALPEKETEASTPVANHIYQTYVPRFTEVSETYRMKNDDRPLRKNPDGTVERTTVRVVSDPDEKPSAATVEENESAKDAVVVNVSHPTPEPETAALNVKKPLPEASAPVEEEPRTVEDERRDIRELFEKPAPAPVAEEPVSQKEEQDVSESSVPEPSRSPFASDLTYPEEEEAPAPGKAHDVFAPLPDTPRPTAARSETKKLRDALLRTEYTSLKQRSALKDRFLDSLMAKRVRTVSAALGLILLFFFENLPLFGYEILFGSFAPAVDLFLCTYLFVLALPETIRGIEALFGKKPTSDLFLPIAFLIAGGYDVAAWSAGITTKVFFGFPFSVIAFAAVLGTYFAESAAFVSFKFLAMDGAKTVVTRTPTRFLEKENLALDGAIDEYRSETAGVRRTSFVTDFFRKNRMDTERPGDVGFLLAVSFATALVAGGVCYFLRDNGIVDALCAMGLVFLTACPAVTLFLHRFSYFRAELESLREDSTAVGEISFEEYAGVDVITFEENEIFGSEDVALRRIFLYGDSRDVTKTMRRMASLFAAIGGPLADMFAKSLDKQVPPATRPEISDEGVFGYVEGQPVLAGTAAFLRERGVRLPDEPDTAPSTTCVLYAAEQGRLCAKFYIHYSFSEEFTMLLPALRAAKITPLVYSRDPNVSIGLLKLLTRDEDVVRVMKKYQTSAQEDTVLSRVSAGIVTVGDKTRAINMIFLAKRYAAFRRACVLTAKAACAVAAVTMALVAVLAKSLPISALAGGFQALLLLVLAVTSAVKFRKTKK